MGVRSRFQVTAGSGEAVVGGEEPKLIRASVGLSSARMILAQPVEAYQPNGGVAMYCGIFLSRVQIVQLLVWAQGLGLL